MIGQPDGAFSAERLLPVPMVAPDGVGGRPAVFIDKDGTLIENVPYNVDPALLRFMPGALAALSALAAAGLALVVVTNQSGLALHRFTRAQLARLQAVLEQRLREEAGVALLDFVVCPHAPGLDGQPACLCRKPAPGMLLYAARKHGLDLSRCWMVGDTLDDVEAGRRIGCRAALYDSGGETVWRHSPMRQPHVRSALWDEIARQVLATCDAAHTRRFGDGAARAGPAPHDLPRHDLPHHERAPDGPSSTQGRRSRDSGFGAVAIAEPAVARQASAATAALGAAWGGP